MQVTDVASSLTVTDLQLEYEPEPNNVPPDRPRFSWRIEAERRDVEQTAYHILVARSEQILSENRGDMWDTGKVESADSTNVVYDGIPLDPDTEYVWKVKVWDSDDDATAFSDRSRFVTALSDDHEWKGDWIGFAPHGGDSNGYRSQWHPASADATEQVTIDLGEQRHVGGVELHPSSPFNGPETPDGMAVSAIYSGDELTEEEVTKEGADGFGFPRGYRVLASRNPGFEDPEILVDRERTEPHGSETVTHDVETEARYIRIVATDLYEFDPGSQFGGGVAQFKTDLVREERRNWQVFALAALSVRDDSGDDIAVGKVVSASSSIEEGGWGTDRLVDGVYESQTASESPLCRTTVSLGGDVEHARAHVCTLGYGEFYINGTRVGDTVLNPGWTEYDERVLYDSYDVGDLLDEGENALGLWLGNGWFNKNARDWTGHGGPRAIVQVNIEYADGTTRTVSTNSSWRAASSPIVANDIYDGETYDAREERPGWATSTFDDTEWSQASIVDAPGGDLDPQRTPPIRVVDTLEPETIIERDDGPILDFGQNLTGWIELAVTDAQAGDTITLRHAEARRDDGALSLVDLRSADVTDTYIANGSGQEQYHPRFTYHGFRYVQISGYHGDLGHGDVTAKVIHTDMDQIGSFDCSNEDLKQVQHNAEWGLRGNVHSVPTDCPQRDERFGWTGDGHIAARALMYNFDSVRFHEKWMRDHDDVQSEHGYLADTVPYGYGSIPEDPTWSITRVMIPWNLYRHYGDAGVLEDHYEEMRRYVDYWYSVSDDGIISAEYGNYGDWLAFENTDERRGLPYELFNTAFQYRTMDLFARIAGELGYEDDESVYTERATHVADRFNEEFFDADTATYGPGTQSSYAVPLYFGLVPAEHEAAVVEGLVEKVHEDDDKLRTGFLGSRPLIHTLVNHDHAELAYEMVSQPERPGWVYMARNDATTMWERWDSDDRVGSGMNSYNHSPLTFVSEWFFSSLVGLEFKSMAGHGRVKVSPSIVEALKWAEGELDTVHGRLACEWNHTDTGCEVTVTIPPNTSGTVRLPVNAGTTVFESDEAVWIDGQAGSFPDGISAVHGSDDNVIIDVGSGTYQFTIDH